jgi:hypothetical protein
MVDQLYSNPLVRELTMIKSSDRQPLMDQLNKLDYNDPKLGSTVDLLKLIDISKVQLLPAPSEIVRRRVYLKKDLLDGKDY